MMRFARALYLVVAVALSACARSPAGTPGAESRAVTDPLPSWNNGATKTAIVDFVHAVTTAGSPDSYIRKWNAPPGATTIAVPQLPPAGANIVSVGTTTFRTINVEPIPAGAGMACSCHAQRSDPGGTPVPGQMAKTAAASGGRSMEGGSGGVFIREPSEKARCDSPGNCSRRNTLIDSQ